MVAWDCEGGKDLRLMRIVRPLDVQNRRFPFNTSRMTILGRGVGHDVGRDSYGAPFLHTGIISSDGCWLCEAD